MIRLTIKEIAEITSGEMISDAPDVLAGRFSIDSRSISPGMVFIAIKGENFNGHDFIGDVLDKGASGIIAEKGFTCTGRCGGRHIILVDDTKKAMGHIAAEIRKRVNIPVVCVTGTSGKTTVKEMLYHLLSGNRSVLRSRKSYNNLIGLSLTLFDLEEHHQAAVLELGTNHPGEIRELAEIARPDIVVITNIGDGHLEFFGSRENVFREKISSLEMLPLGGVAVLNRDDEFLGGVGTSGRETIKFYGKGSESDLVISGISRKIKGSEFLLGDVLYSIPIEGEHNIYNASAALAAAIQLGVPADRLKERAGSMYLPEGRLENVFAGGIEFINDSYNANPGSFESALKVLKNRDMPVKGVVAGDMMELGDKSEMYHRKIGASIAGKGIDFLISVGKEADYISKGAIEAGMPRENIYSAPDHRDAFEKLKKICPSKAVVLVKGSRRARMEEVIKCFTNSCTL